MRRTAKQSPAVADPALELVYKLDELVPPKRLDIELSEEFLSQVFTDAQSEFKAQGAGRLVGELSRLDSGALLRGELTAQVIIPCGRCTAVVGEAIVVPLVVRYLPRVKLEERALAPGHDILGAVAGGSFDARDPDEEPLDNQRVDLRPAVREQLLLALPMVAVCREDCKGLCGSCGQNLNEKTCGCRQDHGDPRWQALKRLKLSN